MYSKPIVMQSTVPIHRYTLGPLLEVAPVRSFILAITEQHTVQGPTTI